MTVQTNTNVASFNGNGVTQIFPIAFKFNNDTDLVVLLVDEATGAASQLTLNSDYTVSGEGDEEGGLINVVVPPAIGERLKVTRIVDILQLTDLRNQGKFFAETHEDALDLLTMIAQQHESSIRSSLRVSESDPEPARIPAAAIRANKILSFDDFGNPKVVAPVSDSSSEIRIELASLGGAAMVSLADGTTVEASVKSLKDTRNIGNLWFYGGDDTGVTASNAALSDAFAAVDTVNLDYGTLRLSASYSVPAGKTLLVTGGRIVLDAGVTLDFSAAENFSAFARQVFSGSGSVTGLRAVFAEWFVGDLVGSTTLTANATYQKAFDAAATGGLVHLHHGQVLWGDVPVSISKRLSVKGSKASSIFKCVTQETELFDIAVPKCEISGFTFLGAGATPAKRPVSGIAVKCNNHSRTVIRDFYMEKVWIGVWNPGTNSLISDFETQEVRSCALGIGDFVADVYVSNFHIYSPYQYLDLTGVTGVFVSGEHVTFGSTRTGIIVEIDGQTLVVQDVGWLAGDTITGETSGATATVSAVTSMHADGGLRLHNHSEGHEIQQGTLIGGQYAMFVDAAANNFGARPAYNRFTDVYFDSSAQGVILSKCADFTFTGCWFSNRPGNGATLTDTLQMTFIGCSFTNNGQHGALIQASCKKTSFADCKVIANCANAPAGTYHGLLFAAGTTDFTVRGCTIGNQAGFAGQQGTGVRVEAGASDRYVIHGNLIEGNLNAGVTDGGTGVNKLVGANF